MKNLRYFGFLFGNVYLEYSTILLNQGKPSSEIE